MRFQAARAAVNIPVELSVDRSTGGGTWTANKSSLVRK